jgi:hypothetical protein
MVWIDQAGGGTGQPGIMQVASVAGNNATLMTPAMSGPIPLADSTQSGLLRQVSGNTTDFIDGTNHSQALQPVITSVRLRSYNALASANCNFEVDQRLCGSGTTVASTATSICDRWKGWNGIAGASYTGQQIAVNVPVPGTNQFITQKALRLLTSTQKTTLVAADWAQIATVIEGPFLRELLGDVHSVQILARSSIANFALGFFLQTNLAPWYQYSHLCTLGAANTWTLIQIPNIPVFAAGGTWALTPGNGAYVFGFCIASGTSELNSANDTWTTSASGLSNPIGQGNLFAGPVGSSVDIAFCQHEPGPQCTTLIDCPFSGPNGNLEACQRYYQKTYAYSTKPGTVTYNGAAAMVCYPANPPMTPMTFKKTMAITPTMTAYSPPSGAINVVYNANATADIAVTASLYASDAGFSGWTLSATPATAWEAIWHYTADTAGF